MIHPCPQCEGEDLYVTLLASQERHLDLKQIERHPLTFDHIVRDERDIEVVYERVECADCDHVFTFDLGAYQAAHPQGAPEPCPYDHDSSPNGCTEDCPACGWMAGDERAIAEYERKVRHHED